MFKTKWLVSGSAFLTLLIRRDAATCVFLIGAIANAISVNASKQYSV